MTSFLENYSIQSGPFQPTWESLQQYRCPEWFRDAKLGIWSHWGPQCVPMAGDWYARRMYEEGHFCHTDHWRRWGHPSKHGYKELIKLWKAENFDPDGLMQMYAAAGAKYFFAQAVHHDNFDNWDSAHNKWNSLNYGPMKDIVGLWRDAAARQKLKFGLSEHLAASFSWWRFNKGADKTGPYAGVPYDGSDPRYEDFYYPNHAELGVEPAPWLTTNTWFHEHWLKRMLDLITKYQPDVLYSDSHLPWDKVGLTAVAHLYNTSAKLHGGENMAVYQQKDHDPAVASIGVLDVERGQIDELAPFVWQTDTCVGGWYYDLRQVYKTPEQVLALLVDIVSKNGCLLLNFTQKPDGTLDDENRFILKTLTDWMAINAEGIHNTRPWKIAMEGPTRSKRDGFKEDALPWTTADFRFTSKDKTVYAFQMAYPERREAFVRSLSLSSGMKVKDVSLLGCAGKLSFRQLEDGLLVQLPTKQVCRWIPCLRVELV